MFCQERLGYFKDDFLEGKSEKSLYMEYLKLKTHNGSVPLNAFSPSCSMVL